MENYISDEGMREFRIGSIAGILRRSSPDEWESIFSDTKAEMLRMTPNFVPELYDRVESFDYQLNGLLDRDYHDISGMNKDQLVKLIEPLRAKIPKFVDSSAESFPYFIVIPDSMVSINEQLTRASNKIPGYTFLDMEDISDSIYVGKSKTPYLILNVNIGSFMRGFSADKGLEEILDCGRLPLSVQEGMAVFTHAPEILYYHGMIFAGSRHKTDGVPDLYLYGGKAKLKRERREDSDPRWGIPYCSGWIFSKGKI